MGAGRRGARPQPVAAGYNQAAHCALLPHGDVPRRRAASHILVHGRKDRHAHGAQAAGVMPPAPPLGEPSLAEVSARHLQHLRRRRTADRPRVAARCGAEDAGEAARQRARTALQRDLRTGGARLCAVCQPTEHDVPRVDHGARRERQPRRRGYKRRTHAPRHRTLQGVGFRPLLVARTEAAACPPQRAQQRVLLPGVGATGEGCGRVRDQRCGAQLRALAVRPRHSAYRPAAQRRAAGAPRRDLPAALRAQLRDGDHRGVRHRDDGAERLRGRHSADCCREDARRQGAARLRIYGLRGDRPRDTCHARRHSEPDNRGAQAAHAALAPRGAHAVHAVRRRMPSARTQRRLRLAYSLP